MIKRLETIKGFGVFRDFVWDAKLPEFRRCNLIYGWNYSGKTTLSRVFVTLEQKKLIAEHPGASFRVLLEDGSHVSSMSLSSSPVVRVFNRDYVNRNFREEHSAPAIFILGEANAAVATRLKHLASRRDRVASVADCYSSGVQVMQADLDKSATDKARDVRNALGDPNFDRTKLNQRIADTRANPGAHILKDEVVQTRLWTLKSGDQFGPLSLISEAVPDFAALAEWVQRLLGQTVSSRTLARLKQNPALESWVYAGLGLHEGSATCEFCNAPLTDARHQELLGHFSEEYKSLIKAVEAAISTIRAINPRPAVHDEMRVLPEYRQGFAKAAKTLSDWTLWATAQQDVLLETLKGKLSAVETELEWEGDSARAVEATDLIAVLNQAIDQHNLTVAELEKARVDAKRTLEMHYAAEHFQDGGIAEAEAKIARLTERNARTHGLQSRIADAIQSIEERAKESVIGAAKLNALVTYLLAGSNIEVVSVGDLEFQFRRGGQPAQHLSEGEKTAIAFAYFLTSLESQGADPANAIVFVDDPVSSLDSNHIYALYALIVGRLSAARQLFVSTHNSELFNLLKSEWLGRNGGNKPGSGAYHIWASVNDVGESVASLQDLPDLLRRYQSEYEFVFSRLYEFANTATPSLHEAYTAPTLMRKFLEAYVGFRRPNVRSWSKKLDILLDSEEERCEIAKFADDASHLQSLGRALQHPEFVTNAKRCVGIVLDGLKAKDEEHFDALCDVLGKVGP